MSAGSPCTSRRAWERSPARAKCSSPARSRIWSPGRASSSPTAARRSSRGSQTSGGCSRLRREQAVEAVVQAQGDLELEAPLLDRAAEELLGALDPVDDGVLMDAE